MANTRIKEFFNGRFFEIPKYQRGYAWEKKNIRELFEDIEEAIEVKASHYIGTLVLSRTEDRDNVFYVVDGQQRITTITMIIHALLAHLKPDDHSYFKRFYIQEGSILRLLPLGREYHFFQILLKDGPYQLSPTNRSQRLLIEAYQEIQNTLQQVLANRDALAYLKKIEDLQIMEFVENNEGDAIRIFQTVNDRGKPLTRMEKAKSLLVYFSNRYLEGELDKSINDKFGEMFEIYDQIKYTGMNNNIDLISGRYGDFNEDNLLRYHFVTFSDEEYDPSANYVLEYLKKTLKGFRKDKASDLQILTFITSYSNSLLHFFHSLNQVIQKADREEKYFRLFSILGLSATLYPIITKLQEYGILDQKLSHPNLPEARFIDLIELIDVRVYKVRGTDPKADIANFAYRISKQNVSVQDIEDWLLWYNERWMNSGEFKSQIKGAIYKRSRAVLPHLFLDYSEHLAGESFSLEDLKQMVKEKSLSLEHVLAQKPKFSLRSHGFRNMEDYLEYQHTLGNLTLLEAGLNSSVNNRNVQEKVNYYDRSRFRVTQLLASQIAHQQEFRKAEIIARTNELAQYMEQRWWCQQPKASLDLLERS